MIEFEENVRALEQRLACPLLGVLPFGQDAAAQKFLALLDVAGLELSKTSTKPC